MSVRILSGGELVNEPWPWAGDWHMASGHVDDFRNPSKTLLDPDYVWRSQRQVRQTVRFLAKNYAQVQLHVFRRGDDGSRVRERGTPLARLVDAPNGKLMTQFDFAFAQHVDTCMWDRWAALKVRDEDGSMSMRRLPPRRWRFVRDGDDLPQAVRFFGPEGHADLDLDRIVWIERMPIDGEFTPMEALVTLLAEEIESERSRHDLWKNKARISGWIERPKSAGSWGDGKRQRFAASWRAAYGRDGTRAGGTPILEDGMQFHQVDVVTPEQAQQIEMRTLAWAEVASAFGVAPELVGAREGNYSNVSEYRQMLYSDALGPDFQQAAQAYQLRLVPDLADPTKVFVEHNVGEKLRLSFEEQAKVLQSATGGPWLVRNEARQRMNLPPIDGADELIVPLNVVEGGQASPTDTQPSMLRSRRSSVATRLLDASATPDA